MNSIYNVKPLVPKSTFQKLFNTQPAENALIEINNLLASKSLSEITDRDSKVIMLKYNFNITDKFPKGLRELYETYLRNCLEDNFLSEKEKLELDSLRKILFLQEEDIVEIHNRLSTEIFIQAYEEAIKDGVYDNSEETKIDDLRANLNIPEDFVNQETPKIRNKLMDTKVIEMIRDNKISPDEWNEFMQYAKNLNIKVNIDDKNNSQVARLKLCWTIENGNIDPIESDIILQKDEICYFITEVEQVEVKEVLERIDYRDSGFNFSTPNQRGYFSNSGSVEIKNITSQKLATIDNGKFYITNKRLIFNGAKVNSSIIPGDVVSLIPYSDGFGLQISNAKAQYFRVLNDLDILPLYIKRTVTDFNK